MTITGPPNIAFKQMPPGLGVVEPFGTTTGCNGVGHRNGPTIIIIMVKELIPIVLSCVVWGWQLAGRRVLIECDNSSVMAAVSKQYTKEQAAMHLL